MNTARRAPSAPLASLLALALALPLTAGCKDDAAKGAAPSATPTPSAAPSAPAPSAAPSAPAASAAPSAAAAPAFPAKELCGKYMIAAPPDAKLEAACFVTADAYRLTVKAGKPESVKQLKEMFGKEKDFKGFLVDEPNGFVAATKDKGGVAYLVMYGAEIGGKGTTCESTLTKSPKTEEKGKEAYAVCKSLAAK
jgi:hypothetical protein